ncbi:MAG: hypothetical protein E7289_00470 [Lachnospiraceae bacterium]|nr:hypothetical protein [Lachnospiraceae bacterium]
MTIGVSQHKYISMDYEAAAKMGRQKGNFAEQMATVQGQATQRNGNAEPVVLGMAFLDVGGNQSLGMTASYATQSTPDNPIIQVGITFPGGVKETYEVAINEINPSNATELEMFALCNYNDALGKKEVASTFGSWHVLKNNGRNAELIGNFSMAHSVEEFTAIRQDWNAMIGEMKENHMEAGVFKQALDADKLLEMFKEYMDALYEKIQNGNINPPSIQTGGAAYTEEEWDKMLENFDEIEEDIRDEMRKEHEDRRVEQLEKEQGIKVTKEQEAEKTEGAVTDEDSEVEQKWSMF